MQWGCNRSQSVTGLLQRKVGLRASRKTMSAAGSVGFCLEVLLGNSPRRVEAEVGKRCADRLPPASECLERRIPNRPNLAFKPSMPPLTLHKADVGWRWAKVTTLCFLGRKELQNGQPHPAPKTLKQMHLLQSCSCLHGTACSPPALRRALPHLGSPVQLVADRFSARRGEAARR